MTLVSPTVGRLAAIFNFMAEHPKQGFTLTDIVRALKLSRTTCHALLSSLVEVGYLYRTADKTYIFGGAFAELARIVHENTSQFQVAAPEMRALADEFDVVCGAHFREGDYAVVKDRAISLSHIGWSFSPLGSKISIKPPSGGVFFAWSKPAEIARWIASADPALTEQEKAGLNASLEFIRNQGYAFGIRKIPIVNEAHAKTLINRADLSNYLMEALDLGKQYDLAMLAAPVFDRNGGVAFILTLMGFTNAVQGNFIDTAGKKLHAVCDRITQFNKRSV